MLIGPIVLALLSRTRTWARVLHILLASTMVIVGGLVFANPQWMLDDPPKDYPGGLTFDVQITASYVGGALLAVWGVVSFLILLFLGKKRDLTPPNGEGPPRST